jgi:hypothetical protein
MRLVDRSRLRHHSWPYKGASSVQDRFTEMFLNSSKVTRTAGELGCYLFFPCCVDLGNRLLKVFDLWRKLQGSRVPIVLLMHHKNAPPGLVSAALARQRSLIHALSLGDRTPHFRTIEFGSISLRNGLAVIGDGGADRNCGNRGLASS